MKAHPESETQNDCCGWNGDGEEEVTQRIVLSPTAQGSICHGPGCLLTELEKTSKALQEMEGQLQVKLMVGEAVMRGILTALERESAEAVDSKEAEVRKIEDLLHKGGMMRGFRWKEDELLNLVDELHHIGHQLAMDTLTERDQVLEKIKNTGNSVVNGGNTQEMSLNLNGQSNMETPIEKKLEDCKEFIALKGREMVEIEKQTKRFELQRRVFEDLAGWEARLKEQFLSDSWLGKDDDVSNRRDKTPTSKKYLQEQSRNTLGAVPSGNDDPEFLKKCAANWNAERSSISVEGEVQELHGQKHSPQEQSSARASQKNADVQFKKLSSPAQNFRRTSMEAKNTDGHPPNAVCEAVTLLRREISELRREKDQLLEEKTDEIYKLKREFYRKLEDVRREAKSVSEVTRLKDKSSGFSPPAAQDGRNSADFVETQRNYQSPDCETRGWLKSVCQRDEQLKVRDARVKDVSIRLACSPEVRDHSSTRASSVGNVDVLESENNRLISVHRKETQDVIAQYQKLLEDKNEELRMALQDVKRRRNQIVELEQSSGQLMNEITALRAEMVIRTVELDNGLLGKVQVVLGSSQRLESDISRRLNCYYLRLEKAHDLLSQQLRKFSESANEYRRIGQNLRLAETEVDVLGDEVDALTELLEKAHCVLNHYAPVIQHYPGLAELWRIVRQEFLQRVSDPRMVHVIKIAKSLIPSR